jgi:hypothetical protein
LPDAICADSPTSAGAHPSTGRFAQGGAAGTGLHVAFGPRAGPLEAYERRRVEFGMLYWNIDGRDDSV